MVEEEVAVAVVGAERLRIESRMPEMAPGAYGVEVAVGVEAAVGVGVPLIHEMLGHETWVLVVELVGAVTDLLEWLLPVVLAVERKVLVSGAVVDLLEWLLSVE